MNIQTLRTFIAITRYGKLTEAARYLNLTQSALSRTVRQIEDEIGAPLFNHQGNRITLNKSGMRFLEMAEDVIARYDNCIKEIKEENGLFDRSIIISISSAGVSIPGLIHGFRKLHPDVSYKVYTINADGVKENIEKGIIELGLITEPVDTSRFETFHLEGKERWGALVKVDDPLAGKEFVYPEDLADKPLIVPIRSEVQYLLESWLGKAFDDLDITARYNLGRNIAVMVSRGVGVGICFDLFSSYEGLKFIPMIPPLMTGSVVCWKKDQLFSTVTRSFIEFLRNAQA